MYDVIIIGKGPAGVSGALYTSRAGLSTLIIAKDIGSLGKSERIENYFGFSDPISGKDLIENGTRQAKRLGVNIIDDEVTGIEYDGNFVIKTSATIYTSKAVLLATGATRKSPKIENLLEYEGKGVSYCAVCDAFFFRGKPVAVLGSGAFAVSEAKELLAVTPTVTILTNGEPSTNVSRKGISIDTRKISKLKGGDLLEQVIFEDGEAINTNGLFIAIGVAGSDDFARKLGVQIKNGKIVTDEKQSTNLPGFYAAGDCTGDVLQIATAVGEGAKAGLEIINYIRNKKGE